MASTWEKGKLAFETYLCLPMYVIVFILQTTCSISFASENLAGSANRCSRPDLCMLGCKKVMAQSNFFCYTSVLCTCDSAESSTLDRGLDSLLWMGVQFVVVVDMLLVRTQFRGTGEKARRWMLKICYFLSRKSHNCKVYYAKVTRYFSLI